MPRSHPDFASQLKDSTCSSTSTPPVRAVSCLPQPAHVGLDAAAFSYTIQASCVTFRPAEDIDCYAREVQVHEAKDRDCRGSVLFEAGPFTDVEDLRHKARCFPSETCDVHVIKSPVDDEAYFVSRLHVHVVLTTAVKLEGTTPSRFPRRRGDVGEDGVVPLPRVLHDRSPKTAPLVKQHFFCVAFDVRFDDYEMLAIGLDDTINDATTAEDDTASKNGATALLLVARPRSLDERLSLVLEAVEVAPAHDDPGPSCLVESAQAEDYVYGIGEPLCLALRLQGPGTPCFASP